jgi:regulatory protein YycH of two-component signal transduction system YycFG
MDNNLILLLVVLVIISTIILALRPWRTEEDTKEVTSEKTTKTVVKVERVKPETHVETKVETLVITESANSGEILTVSSASLESMTVSQLRELAKARNISGYSSMNKTELISKLS